MHSPNNSDLLPGYEALGYEILELPKVSVVERADFVLRETGLKP
jgi:predicted ATPase